MTDPSHRLLKLSARVGELVYAMTVNETYPSYCEVKRRINTAVNKLLERDLPLLELDANERSVSHKLAEYLQQEFEDWDVDCEYNRDGHGPKRVHIDNDTVPILVPTDDEKGTTVFPDIIVHRRATSQNLLCVEMKKAGASTTALKRDRRKLEAYCTQLDYRFSLLVVVEAGRDRPGISAIEFKRYDSNNIVETPS